jgi:hypothetical protein
MNHLMEFMRLVEWIENDELLRSTPPRCLLLGGVMLSRARHAGQTTIQATLRLRASEITVLWGVRLRHTAIKGSLCRPGGFDGVLDTVQNGQIS